LTFNSSDIGYNNFAGANEYVRTTKIQSDGKVIIGGNFTILNGTYINRLARLNTNQTIDQSFNIGLGANNSVWAIDIQLNGKILIGGFFTSLNGIGLNRIARLNSDGSVDSSFAIGSGANNNIYVIKSLPSGKILIGGAFTEFNGISANGIVRLNSDGSIDNSFNTGTGPDQYVYTISIQTDGKIIIGGSFQEYDGVSVNHIVRINYNGSFDSSFNVGSGCDDVVWTSQIQDDGNVIIGGDFSSYNGSTCGRIARISPNGSIDLSYTTGVGADDFIFSSALQSNGKLVVCGQFTSYDGFQAKRMARINADGSYDWTFNTSSGFDGDVYNCDIDSVGRVIAVGAFEKYQGQLLSGVVRLDSIANFDGFFTVGTGADNRVSSISIQSDGKLIVGGHHVYYNGRKVLGLHRVDSLGLLDTTFSPVLEAGTHVSKVICQPDSRILVALGGILKRYYPDGALDSSFQVSSVSFSSIGDIKYLSNGKILVSGRIIYENESTFHGIVRLNTDGSVDSSFSSATEIPSFTAVNAIAVQNDGKIIIAGSFTSFDGTIRNRVARLFDNGLLDNSFNPGDGPNNTLYCVSIQNDGRIII
jgi:uncharacterized delta-60 repeat protein